MNISADEYSFEHGYGLENIKKIVEEHHGIYRATADKYYEVAIVIPILDKSKA